MKELLITLSLLHGADAATTITALHHGAREANPLLGQNTTINLALKSVTATAAVYGTHAIAGRHPKFAKSLAWAMIGVQGAVLGNNLRTLKLQGRR